MILRTLVLSVWLAATAGLGAAQQPRAATRSAQLERWVELVDAHRPGERDAAVVEIASLAPADRRQLVDIATRFAVSLHKALNGQPMIRESDSEVARASLLAAGVAKHTTVNAWLHRAAVLQGDAFILAGELTDAATAKEPLRAGGQPGLLWANDGDVQSTSERNWSLDFGRKLLDQVEPSPRDDEFVGAWYHATAAFLLSRSWLGELRPHLERAEAVRPDDPRIVFDTAVLYEAFSMSRVQTIVLTMPAGSRADVPPVKASEARALAGYRRVLELVPQFVEARVRYGRMLLQSGRVDDAVVALTRAIADTKDPYLLYHAHLFAARAEAKRGRDAEAVAHCRDAARLFPGAQSAQIALSLAELGAGNVPAAMAPVDAIRGMRTDGLRDDPWWSYQTGAGRDADAILESLWRAVK